MTLQRKHRILLSALGALFSSGARSVAAQQTTAPYPLATPQQEERVEGLLRQLTTDEKISLIGGSGFGVTGITRLGIPALSMTDGPYGVRSGKATVLPGGIGLAATWNVDLARREGEVIGFDARARGSNFQLAPAVNIYRAPQAGRNFEYFGEDPYLAAQMAVGYINGIQSQGVSATVKHFLGNDSEYARNYTNAVIDERALHEIYLPAFEAAVKDAKVGAVMDSYNLVNGVYTSANGKLNIDVLKTQWKFPGIVMSDWVSTHDPLGPVTGGLDLEMPFGASMNKTNILPALKDGSLSLSVIDDKVRRLLRTEARFGWLDPSTDPATLPLLNEEGRHVALEAARESIVLLKNTADILPLTPAYSHRIALIGPLAYPLVPVGGGSSQAAPFQPVSLLTALSEKLGTRGSVLYDRGLPSYARVVNETEFTVDEAGTKPGVQIAIFNNTSLSGMPSVTRIDAHVNVGKGIDMAAPPGDQTTFDSGTKPSDVSYRWSGYYKPQQPGPHHLLIYQSGGGEKTGYRIWVDGKLVKDDWEYPEAIVDQVGLELSASSHTVIIEFWARAGFAPPLFRCGLKRDGTWVDPKVIEMAKKAETAVVAVGFDPSTEFEGWDRTFGLPLGQAELIRAVAAVNPRTIVVLQGGGNVDMNGWLASVPALLHAWYPGQEGGTALSEILLGEVSPSGHLPATFERLQPDNPTYGNYYPAPDDHSQTPSVQYREGIFVGYRGYQRANVAPLFPFGFGLSYTTFEMKDITIAPASGSRPGSLFEVSFRITNVGDRAAKAVPQLYVSPVKAPVVRPKEELKAFAKVPLKPGESKLVALYLDARSFSYYDVASRRWIAQPGIYEVQIGDSSEHIVLRSKVRLETPIFTN